MNSDPIDDLVIVDGAFVMGLIEELVRLGPIDRRDGLIILKASEKKCLAIAPAPAQRGFMEMLFSKSDRMADI